jgi:lipopolysaccharide export system permease protein
MLRPLITIVAMVALLAAGLGIGTLAARDNALVPLMWVHALLPGLVCAWLLYGPSLPVRRPVQPAEHEAPAT